MLRTHFEVLRLYAQSYMLDAYINLSVWQPRPQKDSTIALYMI